MEWVYRWSKDFEKSFSLDDIDLENITINNLPLTKLEDFSSYFRIFLRKKEIKVSSRTDLFGSILIKKGNEIIEKVRIAPEKIAYSSESDPEKTYNFIIEKVFKDIKDLLSLIITNYKGYLQTTENFTSQVLKQFPRALDFFVHITREVFKIIEYASTFIFFQGPLHKEIRMETGYNGSQILVKDLFNPTPYKRFLKRSHTHDTILNKMLFQTFFFTMLMANRLLGEAKKESKFDYEDILKEIIAKCSFILNKFHLWFFYSVEWLDDTELYLKILKQNNPYYRSFYKVYRLIREIFLFFDFALVVRKEEGIEMPIIPFYSIYEGWSISKIIKAFEGVNFKVIKAGFKTEEIERDLKLYFKMMNENRKEIKIIWELKFEPLIDSTYYGALLDNINVRGTNIRIKPDITILLASPGSSVSRKALVGDVKFSLDNKGNNALQLPHLDSLYKVLAYLEDLKHSDFLQGYEVEGLLIYPGNLDKPIRVPDKRNENHINIIPLNQFKDETSHLPEILGL